MAGSGRASSNGREVGLLAGAWRERDLEPPARRAPARLRPAKGDLYVFVQVRGSPGAAADAELADQLGEHIAAAYYAEPSRSVTTSLGRALKAANTELYAARQPPSAPPPAAGPPRAAASCVVLHDGEAYFVQVGAALAYLVLPEAVQPLGPAAADGDAPPVDLGAEPAPDLSFAHRSLAGPCSIVLGGADLAVVAPPAALRQVLVRGDHLDAALALRALLEADEARESQSGGGHAESVRALVVDAAAPARRSRPSPDRPQPPRRPAPAEPAPPAAEPEPPAAGPPAAPAVPAGLADQAPGGGALAPPAPLPADTRPGGELLAGDRLVWGLRRAASALAWAAGPARLVHLLLALAAALLVVALAVGAAGALRERPEGTSGGTLLSQAEQRERDGLAAADPALRLRLLTEAADLAGRASRLRPADPTAQALSGRTQQTLDALTAAVRLGAPVRLVGLDGEPTQVVRGGGDLYVLDQATARVYRYPLAADGESVQPVGTPAVFRRGERVGGVTTGAPRQLLWLPGGMGRLADALLVLDDAGRLFEVDPGRGVRRLGLAAPLRPTQPIAGYAGSLFVLDPLAGTLDWRPPGPAGFAGPAYAYFQPEHHVALVDAVALAVDADLYLLRASGRIERFGQGQPLPFAGQVPGRQPGPRSALLATPRSLYAFDPEARRLYEFDRAGAFRRQYVFDARDAHGDPSAASVEPVALALDEARGLLYALSRSDLHLHRLGDRR